MKVKKLGGAKNDFRNIFEERARERFDEMIEFSPEKTNFCSLMYCFKVFTNLNSKKVH